MDKEQAREVLRSLKNVSAFASVSNIPRRTLVKIISGEGQIRPTTLALLEFALKKHKPEQK